MVIHKKDELTANTKVMMWTVCDTTELEQSRLLTEMDAMATMVEKLVAENKAPVMNLGRYQRWARKSVRGDFRRAGEEENLYAVYRWAAKAGRILRKV